MINITSSIVQGETMSDIRSIVLERIIWRRELLELTQDAKDIINEAIINNTELKDIINEGEQYYNRAFKAN